MNRGRIAAALAWVIVGGLTAAPVSAQTFEEMVEDALQRNGGAPATPDPSNPQGAQPSGGQPPTTPAAPQPPADAAAPPAAPLATPPAPQTAAPKPYTPPSAPAAATTAPAPAASAPGVIPDDGTASVPPGEPPADAADGATAPPERTQASLTVEEVNGATFSPEALAVRGANPLVLKTQILLDRAGASPGVIDGFMGGNVAKAIAAVETVLNLKIDGQLDAEVWAALGGDDAGPALIDYTITDEDAAYPYLDVIPKDYAEQAKLKGLNFTSAEEMFGERFHMDAKLVRALNPDKDLRRAGTAITVADVKGQAITGTIVRIEADKKARQVRAYDAQNRLVVAYPATIGSADNPSPSGIHKVNTIAPNPVYYYNPANFVQGENTSRLQLPPGPNNPVGTMWIDLSEPSYGIHGTPEPSKIDKTGSHGCIRLTNWDAVELSTLVKPGVEVTFTE